MSKDKKKPARTSQKPISRKKAPAKKKVAPKAKKIILSDIANKSPKKDDFYSRDVAAVIEKEPGHTVYVCRRRRNPSATNYGTVLYCRCMHVYKNKRGRIKRISWPVNIEGKWLLFFHNEFAADKYWRLITGAMELGDFVELARVRNEGVKFVISVYCADADADWVVKQLRDMGIWWRLPFILTIGGDASTRWARATKKRKAKRNFGYIG